MVGVGAGVFLSCVISCALLHSGITALTTSKIQDSGKVPIQSLTPASPSFTYQYFHVSF